VAARSASLQPITWRYGLDDRWFVPSLPAGQALTFSSKSFNPVRSRYQKPDNPSWRWPIQGRLVLGYAPALPGRKGIHISGKPGQGVRAAAPGRVVYAGGGLPGYGRLIILKHGGNLLSVYGHLRKILVKEGDRVKSGQSVAELGTSNTNYPALYFEIRRNGKPVNPLDFLPERGAGRAI
jgi:lipoprotein NlpD